MNKIKDYITQFKVAIKKMIRDFVEQYAMARGLEIFQMCQMGTYKIKKYNIWFMIHCSLDCLLQR